MYTGGFVYDGGTEEFNDMVHNAAQTCVRILLKILEKL